jgi:hypothetical protein
MTRKKIDKMLAYMESRDNIQWDSARYERNKRLLLAANGLKGDGH